MGDLARRTNCSTRRKTLAGLKNDISPILDACRKVGAA